jgi:3-oxoacyl-[acyl-carrier protein] reductase
MIGKIVLITGASRGLGRRLADGFLADGWLVVGVARSPIETWEGETHERFERQVCDITDESMVKRLFSSLRKRFGHLDVLINNAGAFSSDLLLTANADRFSALLRANLISAQVVTREAVKLMRPKGLGRVVSISSVAVAIPLTGNALYATTKIGLEALMSGFAVEFKGSGVTFNSVGVSFIEDTGMVGALLPAARASYETRLLTPKPLTIGEILHAVRFFVSDDAAPITGQVITLGSPF